MAYFLIWNHANNISTPEMSVFKYYKLIFKKQIQTYDNYRKVIANYLCQAASSGTE